MRRGKFESYSQKSRHEYDTRSDFPSPRLIQTPYYRQRDAKQVEIGGKTERCHARVHPERSHPPPGSCTFFHKSLPRRSDHETDLGQVSCHVESTNENKPDINCDTGTRLYSKDSAEKQENCDFDCHDVKRVHESNNEEVLRPVLHFGRTVFE